MLHPICFDSRDVDNKFPRRESEIDSLGPSWSAGVTSNYWRSIDSLCLQASSRKPSEEVRWVMNIHMCASQRLCRKGLSLARTRQRLMWHTKGQSCICELAIYTTHISEMAACQCLVAMPCAQLASEDGKCKIISNCLCQDGGEKERGSLM